MFLKLQVLRFAKLFPKLRLSDEGLTTVCLQLRKVCLETSTPSRIRISYILVTDIFLIFSLQLVTAHFKQGEKTWNAESLEGESNKNTV